MFNPTDLDQNASSANDDDSVEDETITVDPSELVDDDDELVEESRSRVKKKGMTIEGNSNHEANIQKGYESYVSIHSEVEKTLNSDHEKLHEIRETDIALLAAQKGKVAFNSGANGLAK
ncbi:uncharacterized protein A4U43_C01F18830 [Asparagus officinalis]|uniref:Uncharacterized protein n=1 Tax=Asparagus officinalis TaxID=4686 RepID=A0A5P1FSX2_ASPOF|nr:uncharacterized protein A4U43_C01F18830 [Asparagus officinalis]